VTYKSGDLNRSNIFTDEAYIDPLAQLAPTIMHERGKRYDSENIVERLKLKGSKFHIAA
jgi:hypothetical protein